MHWLHVQIRTDYVRPKALFCTDLCYGPRERALPVAHVKQYPSLSSIMNITVDLSSIRVDDGAWKTVKAVGVYVTSTQASRACQALFL